MTRIAALLLLPLAAFAAPVPEHLKPRAEVQLRYNPARHPFGSVFELTIRNTGPSDLQIWTDRPCGLATFLDCEVLDPNGRRVSRLYQWNSPPDQGTSVQRVETIAARKSHATTLPIFNGVDETKLVPGTYKVRVRFRYQDHDAVTEWIPVDISESQIRTKNLVLGP